MRNMRLWSRGCWAASLPPAVRVVLWACLVRQQTQPRADISLLLPRVRWALDGSGVGVWGGLRPLKADGFCVGWGGWGWRWCFCWVTQSHVSPLQNATSVGRDDAKCQWWEVTAYKYLVIVSCLSVWPRKSVSLPFLSTFVRTERVLFTPLWQTLTRVRRNKWRYSSHSQTK